MAFELYKQTIATHNKLIKQLEDKYNNHITKLLEQKKLLNIELQNALLQQFMSIHYVSNQLIDSQIETNAITCNIGHKSISKDTNTNGSIDSEKYCNDSENSKASKFECNHCHKLLSTKQSLARHIQIHTGEKPFKCNYCDYRSRNKSHLTRHIRIHTGEKPFKCDYCGYRCRVKYALTTHIRIHTGEKPYKCDHCHKRFKQKSALNCHIKIHTGEKPHECDICHHRCRTKQNLNTHIRIHTRQI